MAKCKDCLHYEACLAFSKVINAARDVEQGCEHFKDRTKYVEVVRCKECSYRDPENWHCDHPVWAWYPFSKKPDDFCSYGERRNNNE